MASAAGVSLGAVVSISESMVVSPGPYYYGAAIRDAAITPVEPGTQDAQATVTVVYEIGA
jgi:uncharacterized protein YggE